MKNLIFKFIVGLLALAIGIGIVWTSGILQVLFPQPMNPALQASNTQVTQPSNGERSGKIFFQISGR